MIIPTVPGRGKIPSHDPVICGIDFESSCAACRVACWSSDELLQRQALERLADDEAVVEFRLAKRPDRFRSAERADAILQMLSLRKTIHADPEFRSVVRFVLETVMEGGDA